MLPRCLSRRVTRIKGDDTVAGGAATAAAPARPGAPRRNTMLMVAIGVFVAGIVLSLGAPRWEKSMREARARQTVEQLRAFARAFQSYAKQHREWPPATSAAGQVPTGMEDRLDETWSRRTPIGGRYLWAPDALHRGQRYPATILFRSVAGSSVANDRELLQAIDRGLDDGNLRSGRFQIGYRDQPFFSLEP